MRILALAIFGMLSIGPATAQTYDQAYPVSLRVYKDGANYYECSYTSLAQCSASASGRAAQCVINPILRARKSPGNDTIAGILASARYDLAAVCLVSSSGLGSSHNPVTLGLLPVRCRCRNRSTTTTYGTNAKCRRY
jgi:hypothetical protein